ncbi:hypothetical protein JF544_06090 [Halobacillus kuroshimensis]|uniref:Uncharacterized protein n=1 Tax=Halobacillus kuroshimensis TaxID=302481 RepID=A0ABS3DTZ9_9BACI|nr:hypothetical protein [Halobacillus kuroshimensis]MBN8234809.1 hypothetical protein [Halobacillus kuroshimensis]
MRIDYNKTASKLTQSGLNYKTAVIHHKAVVREVPGSQGLTSEYRSYVRKNGYNMTDSMILFRT